MPTWFARLFYTLIIFPSFAFNAQASDDGFENIYEVCRQGFNASGGYANSVWPINFIDLLEDPWRSSPPSLPIPDTPIIPKNPQEEYSRKNSSDEEREERQSFSAQEEEDEYGDGDEDEVEVEYEDAFSPPTYGLTKAEAAEIRANINRKKDRNLLLLKLLRTLESKGTCEYETLRNNVTSEGKRIYSLCGFCRNYGWIKSTGIGIWDITKKGLYALKVLETKNLIETTPSKKRDRQMEQEERDEDEDDEDLPAPPKPKKNKANPDLWPVEFWSLNKPEKHFAILKVLENEEYYTAREIYNKTQLATTKLEHVKSYIAGQKEKGWISINKKNNTYKITQKGLNIIEQCNAKQPAQNIDEEKTPQTADHHLSELQKRSSTPPLRTRSLNDLNELEMNQPRTSLSLPRPAELKKRRLTTDDSYPEVVKKEVIDRPTEPVIEIAPENVVPRFYWEQLPEKIRQNLIKQLETDVMPSVLTDGQRMQALMEGNFLNNLHQEISAVFFKKYEIKIDNWLEIHLKDRLKILFIKSNSD